MKENKIKGFTLIELLVVISIIMLLMAIGINSYINAQKVARDGRRKADLKEIQSALEMYRADISAYPVKTGNINDAVNGLAILISSNYINSLPSDPTTSNLYYYKSSNGFSYEICSYLENTNDPDVKAPTPLSPCSLTVSCGSASCNFGVKSP